MTTIGQFDLIMIDPRVDGIRDSGGRGWQEFQILIAGITQAIAQYHNVDPNSVEYINLDLNLQIGPRAEARFAILHRMMDRWYPRNDPGQKS